MKIGSNEIQAGCMTEILLKAALEHLAKLGVLPLTTKCSFIRVDANDFLTFSAEDRSYGKSNQAHHNKSERPFVTD